MCNLYSMTQGPHAIRELTRAMVDRAGNLPPLPAIFPDTMAPVVCNAHGGRELVMMRWGFPPPASSPRPVTNIRNTSSPFWRAWLKPSQRCLVPVSSFCEWTDSQPKVPHWFALNPNRPLFAFAGLWRPWTGERKGEQAEHQLFAFLTTEANAVVKPIHGKAMPVLLTTQKECDAWLTGSIDEALALQRPLPPEQLHVVATGKRQDGAD